MPLADSQRAMIRSRRLQATLAATVRSPSVENHHERDTAGPDPWDAAAAAGHDHDAALNRGPLVTMTYRSR